MKRDKSTEKKITDKLDVSFTQLEKLRGEGLEKIYSLHSIKNRVLKKEHKRLSDKLGADHPRVKKMAARIDYNQGMFKDLKVEIEKANISVPSFGENSWMVHGRILDKDRKGVSGLTVGLYDEKGNWIRQLGYGCTDKRGYFSIVYTQKDRAKWEIPESMKLFLYVSDKDHKILYKDTDPLYLKVGEVDYREIYLLEEKDICTPPKPGKEDTVPPPDVWVIKGRVTDESGRGIAGLTVNPYDKDLLFDDRLGTTVTDKDGHFMVSYKTKDFRDLIEARSGIYLKVMDKEGKKLYSSRRAVRFEAGRVEDFNIRTKSEREKE